MHNIGKDYALSIYFPSRYISIGYCASITIYSRACIIKKKLALKVGNVLT